jgi:predicted HicB family RNase H-like nuclease
MPAKLQLTSNPLTKMRTPYKRFVARLDPATHLRLKKLAHEQNCSMNYLVLDFVKQGLGVKTRTRV